MSNKKSFNIGSMLSETVSLHKERGQVVVNNGPPPTKIPSEKQAAVQAKFMEAVQYAKRQIAEDESKALYATGISDKKVSAFFVAMSDYLSAPKVNSIDALQYHGVIGDPIVVNAIDDFMVTKVWVIIKDATGAIIEQGNAGPDEAKVHPWQYKATVANPSLAGTKIQAFAYDRPGNTGTLEVVL